MRRRTRVRIFIFLATLCAGFLLYFGVLLRDDTGLAGDIDKALLEWAEEQGLLPSEGNTARRMHRTAFRKWISIERAFWFVPPKTPEGLKSGLAELAKGLELEIREEELDRHKLTAVLVFPDGRPAARMTLWRRVLVAICIDDIGYQMKAARRIAALPCPLTCAVIPFTPRARQAAALLHSAGKEIFLHMPMESLVPLPDVPEYGQAIVPGQDQVALGVCVDKALEEIPQAVGLNNHEGSLATEDWETMSGLMEVLRRRDLIFMDSATTARTVAWKAAGAVGVRWAMRDIFIDHTLEKSAIEGYFEKLLALARRQGSAIGVGHTHAKTLDALERVIPKAMADGVIFVPVSELAQRGARRSRLSKGK